MKVLVLGANGFIGARLVARLLEAGHEVKVLTRSSGKAKSLKTEVFVGDLTNPELDFESLLDGCEVVFNCAGEIHDPLLMQEIHVASTQRFLDVIARRPSNKIKVHWVQLSSVGAYGSVPDIERIVTEDTDANPQGQYEVTKTLADEVIVSKSKAGGFTYSILRPSNVFGEGMPNNSIRQLIAIIRRRMFFYIGFDEPIVTYIHVEDVVSALILCGFDRRAKGEIFNISNDCSLREMVEGIANEYSISVPKLKIPKKLIRFLVGAVSKASKGMITQERVNALTSRTHYPSTKLKEKLDFSPENHVPRCIAKI